jgi:Fur family transcriptional regulator, ferric uptake regulator
MTYTQHNCITELRTADLKVTPARLGVLDVLEKASTPLDVATIVAYLQKRAVKADKVTVFRIIHALTEKGLIMPIQLGEGKFRYEHMAKADHHHFICESCSVIEDISDCKIDELQKEIQIKKGLLIKRHSLEFFGVCKSCQR